MILYIYSLEHFKLMFLCERELISVVVEISYFFV